LQYVLHHDLNRHVTAIGLNRTQDKTQTLSSQRRSLQNSGITQNTYEWF